MRLRAPSGALGLLVVARGGLLAGLIAPSGDVRGLTERAVDGDVGLTTASEVFREALATAGLAPHDVSEVFLALPAPVHDGRIVPLLGGPRLPAGIPTSTRLRRLGESPGAALEDLLSVRVRVENDANLEALGEATFGAARGADITVHVKLVGGLGAGVVIGGELIRGSAGFAGELAHMHVDDNGPVCRCGNRGCLAGRVDLAELTRMKRPAFDKTMKLETVIAHCSHGDEPTLRMLQDLGRLIGEGLGGACVVLNPNVITIDGALGAAVEPLIDGVREGVSRTAPGAAADAVRIVAGSLGLNASLYGALALAFPS